MRPHHCKRDRTCSCTLTSLEPDEECPVHGTPWPPRCGTCGRFLTWNHMEFDMEYDPETNFGIK
jgi:hypothetical protein